MECAHGSQGIEPRNLSSFSLFLGDGVGGRVVMVRRGSSSGGRTSCREEAELCRGLAGGQEASKIYSVLPCDRSS